MEIPIEVLTACCTGIITVVGALWWQVRDRIKALESAVKAQIQREGSARELYEKAQEERIKAANNFAAAMRELAEKTTRSLDRNAIVAEKNQDVLARLIDHLGGRPCLLERPDPRPQHDHRVSTEPLSKKTPSSADLPSIEPPTDLQTNPPNGRWRKTI